MQDSGSLPPYPEVCAFTGEAYVCITWVLMALVCVGGGGGGGGKDSVCVPHLCTPFRTSVNDALTHSSSTVLCLLTYRCDTKHLTQLKDNIE